MKPDPTPDPLFDLPAFDIPQREPGFAENPSYEEAMIAFEEIARELGLNEIPRPREEIPLFELS